MASAKPTQPPAADMSVLVKRVNDLSLKAGLTALPAGAGKLPAWKRWLGSEKPDYDGKGLRDVVNQNAIYLDDVKRDLDDSKENNGVAHASFDQRLKLLEAQADHPPFPG